MSQSRSQLLLFGDVIAFLASFFFMLQVGFGAVTAGTLEAHTLPFSLLGIMWLVILYMFELYDLSYQRRGIALYEKISQALLTITIVSALFFYAFPFFGITPRLNLALNIVFFGVLLLAWRIVFSDTLAKRLSVPATIYDPAGQLGSLCEFLTQNPQFGLGPIRCVSSLDPALPKVVVIDSAQTSTATTEKLLSRPDTITLDATTIYERYAQKIPLALVDGRYILQTAQTDTTFVYRITHAILDPLIAVMVAGITLPITLLAALLIYLEDRGPIFYTQTRTGLYGKSFQLYKFRSMAIDAEPNGAEWSSGASDPRVTRIGRILRKLHVDELPQMLNILKGDLALIGPRAERPEFVAQLEKEIPHYRLRHIIKPGFTGWAQIKFFYARSIMDSYEKFEYDLYYIKHRNLVMDLAILARTAYIILKH